MASEEPPAYTVEDRAAATVADVKSSFPDSTQDSEATQFVLRAYSQLLTSGEKLTVNKNQFQVLRAQTVLALEGITTSAKEGGDPSDFLRNIAEILTKTSERLKNKSNWEDVLKDTDGPRKVETIIDNAFDNLESELHKILKKSEAELPMYREEMSKARENDRKKISEFVAIANPTARTTEELKAQVQNLIDEKLKIIGDPTQTEQMRDAMQVLSIIADLTGDTSLPPDALPGQEFVKIGQRAIHQGTSYDVFLSEYFTGQKVAAKVLRHRVDKKTAKDMQRRFSRQVKNWSAMRHESILPFYGLGIMPSPVVEGEYQIFMLSPYLKDQDISRFLKKHADTPRHSRLQMILDVANGLSYMHNGSFLDEPGQGVVHSALNIFNVLVKDSGRAVISGFGHSKVIKDFQESFTGDNSEYRYMAPEIMDQETGFSYPTDIWSWAMTSLEILSDELPFGRKNKGPRIIVLINKGEKPRREDYPKLEQYGSNDELWNIFEKCWDANPEARPPAKDVVKLLEPLLENELGKKTQGASTPTDPPPHGKGPSSTQAGRPDTPVKQGQPVQPPPGQNQLGKPDKPVIRVATPPPPSPVAP